MTIGSPVEGSAGPQAKSDLWLICPICKQPNPSGTLHCKFCWGASLYSVHPISTEELTTFTARREKKQKRWTALRTAAIAIGAPALLLAAVFFWIYAFTDLMFAPPAHLNSTSQPGESAMYRHDLARTGAMDASTVNPTGKLKWSFQTDDEIRSTPAVANGVVYFGSNDHKLYALDAATGQKRWEFQVGSWVESSPAVVNGVVYFGSNDGFVYALDAITGQKLWAFETPYAVKSSPAVAGNVVYIGGDDYFVYALDARTGKQIWQFETESHVMSSPVVANGILYIGSMDFSCYALNAETGRFRLRMNTFEVLSSPAVVGDKVYFTSRNFLFAMDGKARNWPGEDALRPWWLQFYAFRLAPPPPPRSGVVWGTRLSFSASDTTPVVSGDALFTSAGGSLYRVDLTERKTAWTFPAGSTIRSSPALANNVLYVGDINGLLHAVNAETGKEQWKYNTGMEIRSSPTYANGIIYVTSRNGSIYALE